MPDSLPSSPPPSGDETVSQMPATPPNPTAHQPLNGPQTTIEAEKNAISNAAQPLQVPGAGEMPVDDDANGLQVLAGNARRVDENNQTLQVLAAPVEAFQSARSSSASFHAPALATHDVALGEAAPASETLHDPALWEAMWGEGENRATRFGRAACTLLIGGFLTVAQNRAVIDSHLEWNRWIWLSVVANFLLPAIVVWLFFAQGLRRLDWLSDQRLNAWNYGWNWRQLRRHALLSVACVALMLPFLWIFSRSEPTRLFYQNYFPALTRARDWWWLWGTLILYMACWEWFFRGFMLFGMAQGFGPGVAIGLQSVIFGLAHAGKPPLEMASSFAGGLILGIICWRENSFVPAFFTHALIQIVWSVLVLKW